MSTSATGPSGVEAAAALLETELAQLEKRQAALQERQRAVERELSGLAGRIESIRGALDALRAVPPATTTPAGEAEDDPDTTPTPAPTAPAAESLGSRFTDQVIAVLARDPGAALRARDVAEVLGRAQSAGTINAVRSTLDRLVATSRARRVGRGLYQAPAD
ncbi:hypothetical protein [Streptomyces broussonetiae]|uniref:Uncharacterized protein n=1 Tax=Streptomyces broussonetiae TaxID=2686304 RepID=A0ABV5EHX3_9ACTN